MTKHKIAEEPTPLGPVQVFIVEEDDRVRYLVRHEDRDIMSTSEEVHALLCASGFAMGIHRAVGFKQ